MWIKKVKNEILKQIQLASDRKKSWLVENNTSGAWCREFMKAVIYDVNLMTPNGFTFLSDKLPIPAHRLSCFDWPLKKKLGEQLNVNSLNLKLCTLTF